MEIFIYFCIRFHVGDCSPARGAMDGVGIKKDIKGVSYNALTLTH